MTLDDRSIATLSDTDLLATVKVLADGERAATAQLVAALAEIDTRRLYLGEGCSSLFTYCTQVLHLSEQQTYGRIEAARAVRRFPVILDYLARGLVHLTGVCVLAPHLTVENHEAVLAASTHKTRRQVEEIVAALRPQPVVPPSVRKLPMPTAISTGSPDDCPKMSVHETRATVETQSREGSTPVAVRPVPPDSPQRRAEVVPLSTEYFKVTFAVTRETREKLRHAQDLLRHVVPTGDVAALFDRALTLLIADAERTKFAATDRPRDATTAVSTKRRVPAAVRRAVWRRDGGRCAFRGTQGRCTERGCLEFHHVVPYADGGETSVANLELRCRAHNRYEAEQWFGPSAPECVREKSTAFGAISCGETETGSDRSGSPNSAWAELAMELSRPDPVAVTAPRGSNRAARGQSELRVCDAGRLGYDRGAFLQLRR